MNIQENKLRPEKLYLSLSTHYLLLGIRIDRILEFQFINVSATI